MNIEAGPRWSGPFLFLSVAFDYNYSLAGGDFLPADIDSGAVITDSALRPKPRLPVGRGRQSASSGPPFCRHE